MKTILAVVATGGVLAASLLLACGDDEASPPPGVDRLGDAALPDAPREDTSDAGSNDAAMEARPPYDAAPPDIACAAATCIKSIVAGPRNYCATAMDGAVHCWGAPDALGDFVDVSAPNPGATPVSLGGLGTVVDVAIGNFDTCVVIADGTVQCFGSSSPSPSVVADIQGAKRVTVSDQRKCAVLEGGALRCWGDNDATGHGDGPVDVGGEKVVAARMQASSAFALAEGGDLFSWGGDAFSLGRTSAISPDLTPAPVTGLPPVREMAASDAHACALTVEGHLFCWGQSFEGALGLGYFRNEPAPVEVLFPWSVWPAQIAASETHSCARLSDGSLSCWSRFNDHGQLGYASTDGVYAPAKVALLDKPVVSVAVGNGSTCALGSDGSVQCFGDNGAGQLGQGTIDTSRHFVPVTVNFP